MRLNLGGKAVEGAMQQKQEDKQQQQQQQES